MDRGALETEIAAGPTYTHTHTNIHTSYIQIRKNTNADGVTKLQQSSRDRERRERERQRQREQIADKSTEQLNTPLHVVHFSAPLANAAATGDVSATQAYIALYTTASLSRHTHRHTVTVADWCAAGGGAARQRRLQLTRDAPLPTCW